MRSRPPLTWAALVLALGFVAWHWARIESPAVGAGSMAVMGLLGVLPAVVTAWRGRTAGLVALAVSAVVAVGAVTGVWPWRSGFGYVGDAFDTIDRGARLWFSTHTPFDPGRFASVDDDVRLAFFAIAAVLGWLVLVRGWAVPAIGVAFLGFALPSTVVDIGASGARAALFLAVALLLLRALVLVPLGGAGSGQAFGVGTAVVTAALIVSALPGVNKGAFLNWHSWNPLAHAGPQVAVNYVWNQTYAPLHWPKKRTTVLEVWAPGPMYWRVTTLERFDGARWLLSETPLTAPTRPGRRLTMPPGFAPSNALTDPEPSTLVTVRVKVDGLADRHLVGAAQPLAWDPPDVGLTQLVGDGAALADRDLPRGTVYTSQVYAPDPKIKDLQRAGGAIPANVEATATTVNGKRMRTWPAATPGRVPLNPALVRASNQVWHASGADTADNEWLAVAAVENYLRSKPFAYDETPTYRRGTPVLADFMLRSHHGYCQMFSGAMGLVLRLHGIPTRIGVGFTTGVQTSEHGAYVVTDHDAHAWVEVYFSGWGWQQFDPTPTRHLPSETSVSNNATLARLNAEIHRNPTSAENQKAAAIFHLTGGKAGSAAAQAARRGIGAGSGGTAAQPNKPWRPGFISAAFLLAIVVLLLVALAKALAIRARYLRRGARAQASAAYHELSTFLGDQGVPPVSSRTFEDLAGELDRVYGVDATGFARSASRARYGPERQAARAGRELRRELRTVKRDLRRQLTRRERATGALRLRSALSQATSLD